MTLTKKQRYVLDLFANDFYKSIPNKQFYRYYAKRVLTQKLYKKTTQSLISKGLLSNPTSKCRQIHLTNNGYKELSRLSINSMLTEIDTNSDCLTPLQVLCSKLHGTDAYDTLQKLLK